MAAKDIEFGSDARSKMLKGVETLAKAVKINEEYKNEIPSTKGVL